MQSDAFILGEQIKLHTFEFKLYPKLWDEFEFNEFSIEELNWQEVKFLNDDASDFSDQVKALPSDQGGIYLFIIKNPVLPSVSEFLAYIGRAKHTATHNLRVRCKRYHTTYLNEKERPKITTLMNYFKDKLYLRYATIDDNNHIDILEAELINSILPPFNDVIPKKITRQAIDAF
ncbi:MAG: hypothetical protein K8R68_01135 [Bacteroidales bacterium]|nr:hypothetical protein [Bacteroidales bacterium]